MVRTPSLHENRAVAPVQRSFAGGEIAPSLYARADQVKYATGLRKVLNFEVMKHGGVTNRAGFEFITEVKNSDDVCRLIPFVFNDEQTYVLELGDQYIRFFRSAAAVSISTPSAWVISTAYAIKDLVVHNSVNYYCYLAHTSADTSEPGTGATYTDFWHTLTGTIYEIPSPWAEADLAALRFVQSGDILTICHPSYAPRDLERTGHTSWQVRTVVTTPEQAAPTSESVTGGTGTGEDHAYQITAVASVENDFEESLPSGIATLTDKGTPTVAAANVVAWTNASGAAEYNIYKQAPVKTGNTGNLVFGYLGTSAGTPFNDDGTVTPDYSDTPPQARALFATTDNFPQAVGYVQQRKIYGGTNNDPEKNFLSRIAKFKNFSISSPIKATDSVTWVNAGNEVHRIAHYAELGKLLVFTEGGEWQILGGTDGIIKPGEVDPKPQSYEGSGNLRPLIVAGSALFVQARGNIVRDLSFEFSTDKFTGDDLTLFAPHFFLGFTLVDWAYQKTPNSIVWCVRSDGILLGLTFLKPHEIFGWHQHDSGAEGLFENVCVVPEGTEDYLYVCVKRTIDGSAVRYIERKASRQITTLATDAKFLDSFLSYDGSSPTGTLALTGGTNWDSTEDITATLAGSSITLDSSFVGDQFWYDDGTNGLLKFTIKSQSSGTVAVVRANKDIPSAYRSTALSGWEMARAVFSGLLHLKGETVSILADGDVKAQEVVSSIGELTVDDPGVHVHIGIPITADIETLDLDNPDGRSFIDLKKQIKQVDLFVESSRGIFAGPDASDLQEFLPIEIDVVTGAPELITGIAEIIITSTWNTHGRIYVRQTDPLPLSILAAVPIGEITD